MENSLPPILEMYSSTRQNRDFTVIRKYQNLIKTQSTKKSITKKGHYLDDSVKMSCSPGPANKANIQHQWAPKNSHQCKYSDRKTYIDQVQRISKKRGSPSPDRYSLTMPWPKKESKVKLICEKTTFVDTSQYESDKTPGPGSYIVATKISKKQRENKYTPHKPLKTRQNIKADMTSYDPCPANYSTFMKYSLMPKQKGSDKKKQNHQSQKILKKQNMPGPGAYQTINTWRGKQPLKKTQLSYLNSLSRGPSMNIYYH